MNEIDKMLEELAAALAALVPELEGYEDLYRSMTEADGTDARREVSGVIAMYKKRKELLAGSKIALLALKGDSYPALVNANFTGPSYKVVTDNVKTINAAYARATTTGEATDATVTIGQPIPR